MVAGYTINIQKSIAFHILAMSNWTLIKKNATCIQWHQKHDILRDV